MAVARAQTPLKFHNPCRKGFSWSLQRRFSRQPRVVRRGHLPEPEPEPESREDADEKVLSIAERCKNILSVNWRGQLTTLKPKLIDQNEQTKSGRTYGEFSSYVFVNGKAVVWIRENSNHCPNLLINNRVSFIVGHTDPYSLMKVFRQVKKVSPHNTLLGTLSIVENDETLGVDHIKMTLKTLISASEEAIKQASPPVKAILDPASHVLKTRMETLSSMLESKGEDAFYQLDASSCHFMDMFGKKHSVNLLDAANNCPDSLSPLIPVIMEGINLSNARRFGLRVLCAWYLQIRVEDAFVYAMDRWGLNVFARVPVGSENVEFDSKQTKGARKSELDGDCSVMPTFEWRDLRLSFKEEVRDLHEFCVMLGSMERESLAGFSKFKDDIKSAALSQRKTVQG